MNCYHPAVVLGALLAAAPAVADPPQQQSSARRSWSTSSAATSSTASAERWVRQLDNEINHLQEDLHYQRGTYPRGLDEQAEQTARAVAHFHQMLSRSDDRRHLMRDFQEMDQQVHRLVDLLNQSDDAWLRRQASRILYSDEQLHYALRAGSPDAPSEARELLARLAHLLEDEAANLRQLSERVDRNDGRLRRAVAAFADEARHFHQTIERGASIDHLQGDFRQVDETWHQAVDSINQSAYGFYLRRTAQDVNRVHNQIHGILAGEDETRSVNPPPNPPANPPQRVERQRGRPAIQFEIPGIGRFQIPR